MIRFHFCNKYNDKIKGQPYEETVRNKVLEYSKRKNLRNIGSIQAFTGNIYVMKTNTPKTRTIIQEQTVDTDGKQLNVFFVRDIIAGNNIDHYFGKVVFPQLKNGEWIKKYPLNQLDCKAFKTNYRTRQSKEDETKEKPPTHLTNWIEDYKLIIKYDIYETEEWVKYALNESISEGMRDVDVKTFGFLLDHLTNNDQNVMYETIKAENNMEIKAAYKYDIGIVFSEINLHDGKVLLLLNGAHLEVQKTHWENAIQLIKKYPVPFDSTFDSISRIAYRAYPKWTVKNYEKWFAIQKNHEISNLSLTREQLDFFRDFKFPYYINGQAGSGKSTMLYYLFANVYYYKCMGEIKGDIIFLTENEILLEHTQKSVFDLLSNNPEFDGLSIEQRTDIDKCFASFKEFLLNQLTKDDRELFSNEKYLNFSMFKNLYENSHLASHIKSNYTAEESWFVIITYIYGYDSLKKITGNDYQNDVYAKAQQIPKEKYEGIEKNVLPFYEKLLEDGYWDKLKIIKYIEENIKNDQKYTVVICDEAQDFCRVELQFILHQSEYLQYNLADIEQVPVVFAGDPNQTVNPSGFREREMNEMLWSELKPANFEYDKDESVYSPTFNYRSAQPVVSLANFIQYYRKKKFGIRLVKPQIAKRPEPVLERNFNFFYNYSSILKDNELKENITSKIKYKIFIVPVDAHEKDEYKRQSEFLSIIDNAEIKTAVEAKGAEYQQVVLYGFGEYFINRFKEFDTVTEDEKFQRRYFFNKLYVGITRAQTELIIIDSYDAENKFWKQLVNHADITDRVWGEQLNDIRDKVIIYNPGTVLNLIESTPKVALENARQDKERGIYDNNAARLHVAGSQFIKLGEKDEGYDCMAKAEAILENFESAGNLYLKNNDIDNAAAAYLKGKIFDMLIEKITPKPKTIKNDIRLIIAQLMLGSKLLQSDINKLYKGRHTLRQILQEISWRNELIEALIEDTKNDREPEQQRDLMDILETIARETDVQLWSVIADTHFLLNYFERATQIWERFDMHDTTKYTQAKVELARQRKNFEDELIWLGELCRYKDNEHEKTEIETQIIGIYKKNPVDNVTNHYYYLHAYKAFLIHQPKDNVENIGQIVEKNFVYELPNLIDFYKDLLQSKRLNTKIAEFTIERLVKTLQKQTPDNTSWIQKFNYEYKQLAAANKIPYNEYSIEEIAQIPELPDEIMWKPPEKTEHIKVTNFRQFSTLELTNMAQFNLIVGDNNTGKTSLLELLTFTAREYDFAKRLALTYADRVRLTRYFDDEKNEQYHIPKHFLNDYIRKDAEEKEITFMLKSKRSKWEYKLRIAQKEDLPAAHGLSTNDFYIFETIGGKHLIETSVLLKDVKPADGVRCPVIPFGKGFDKDLAQVYYDEIDKRKRVREAFLDNMRVFIPRIDRISADTETGEISIEEDRFDEAAPLHQYGEGANKLFRILVQLTLQSGKRLLVDEIDAGIHYSRFKQFWKVILKVAKKEDIQLFVTTHNIECIKYFDEILNEDDFKDYQNNARVITMEDIGNTTIEAFTRTFEEFDYEIKNELEIRGGDE